MSLKFETADVRMLADIGFLGISRGHLAEADAVFDALRGARSEASVGFIGGALSRLGRDDAAGALDVLKSGPQDEQSLAFQVIVLMRLGERGAAAEIVQELEETAPASPMTELARASLADGQV